MAQAVSLQQRLREGYPVLKRHLAAYRREITVLVVLSLLSAVTSAAIPYIAGTLFDSILSGDTTIVSGRTFPVALVILGVWFIFRGLGDIAAWQKTNRQEKLGAVLDADFMVRGYSALLFLPISFHKKKKLGEMTEAIHRASSWLEKIINRVLIELLPEFLSIFMALGIAFWIEPLLALVLMGALGLYAALLFQTAPGLGAVAEKMNTAYRQAHGRGYDALANIHAIKQAGAEEHERRELFRFFNLRAARLWTKYIGIWEVLNFQQRIIITMTQLLIFAFSVFFISEGRMTIGELAAFNGYAAMMFGPFVVLGRNWDVIQQGIVAVMHAEKILDLPPEKYVPDNAIIPDAIRGGIRFDSVSFSYEKKRASGKAPHRRVLENISFDIPAGSLVALVGESGVGKSTLVDLISRYYAPTSGSIYVDGHDVRRLDLKTLRTSIAVVPQELMLFNDTVKHNIGYGSFGASDEEIEHAAALAHAKEFIERFPKKYAQRVGERGIRLSVGQKQRIAIARAILRDPKILILDEPTSALDADSEKRIQESLETLMKGRTTLIIAHRLSTVRKADRILVLKEGRIAESGRHDELVTIPNGIYRRLYELQIGLA